MHAWPAPAVAPLPGTGLPVRVFDTAAGAVVPTSPGPTARLYVCGITPYDATHLGHAATYVAFDLLNRAWRDAGHRVRYVQNVTDVDDPLLERAERDGIGWAELAERGTDLFRADMAALRVLPPAAYVGAVESIPLVVALIERLQARGAAYDVDGDVYFAVAADARFGSVAGLSPALMLELFGERGGDPDRAGKKDPLDCLLWVRARPGEPAWDSPLGPGRPGWHIECTAIAREHLGASFDVQGGGRDLAFPHHEMCAAQARVADGRPFAQAYVHAGMVGLNGDKMSKSRGNLVFVSRLRAAGVDPAAIRLALLGHHYRSDWEWTDAALAAAGRRLDSWRTAVAGPTGPPGQALLGEVRAALAEDLDAPRAVAAVDRWAADARRAGPDAAGPGLVADLCDALLGVDVRVRPARGSGLAPCPRLRPHP